MGKNKSLNQIQEENRGAINANLAKVELSELEEEIKAMKTGIEPNKLIVTKEGIELARSILSKRLFDKIVNKLLI